MKQSSIILAALAMGVAACAFLLNSGFAAISDTPRCPENIICLEQGWSDSEHLVRQSRQPTLTSAPRSAPLRAVGGPAPLQRRSRRGSEVAMSSNGSHRPRVLAIDAGGTMTDTFVVDENGDFVVGKAQTTPEDEADGFLESAEDAFRQWGATSEQHFPGIVSGVFSGTAMLNRLLSRKGLKVGAIVTAGQEDILRMERAIQTYLGYSYSDRLHVATHFHNEPLIPRARFHGVRGRIDLFGNEVLKLRAEDVRDGARRLLDDGVEGIVVCFLFSYRNPAHEAEAKAIIEEVKAERGVNGTVPVFVSSELYPARREFPRLNTTVIEAYAAEPSRSTLKAVVERTKAKGAGFELRVMAAHGGTISTDAEQLATTLISGPIGGVVGARWLAEQIGAANVLCTDIGGTSFDIALVTGGKTEIDTTPDAARFMLSIPLVQIDSVGAGAARSSASIRTPADPRSDPTRPEPVSARPGPRAGSRRSRSRISTSCSAG